MFEIIRSSENRVALIGRLDASHEEAASSVLDALQETTVLDFGELKYLASAGLGLLLKT